MRYYSNEGAKKVGKKERRKEKEMTEEEGRRVRVAYCSDV